MSSDSLGFDLNIFFHSIKPTPFKTNIDYYRGKTKSIYEKEPIFRDFARNIPLSQSLDDSTSLHELKRDFQKLVSARDPVLGRPDPLKPSAVGPIFFGSSVFTEKVLYSGLICSVRVKTDFTSRKAKCFLRDTKVKRLLQSSSPTSTSTTGEFGILKPTTMAILEIG